MNKAGCAHDPILTMENLLPFSQHRNKSEIFVLTLTLCQRKSMWGSGHLPSDTHFDLASQRSESKPSQSSP